MDNLQQRLDIKHDIWSINAFLKKVSETKIEGVESSEKELEQIALMVNEVNKKYNINIINSVAGLEGFVDSLKSFLSSLTKKDKPRIIKNSENDLDKAVTEYSYIKFIDDSVMIEGNIKVSSIFNNVKSAKDIIKAVEHFISVYEKTSQSSISVCYEAAKHASRLLKTKDKSKIESSASANEKFLESMKIDLDAFLKTGNISADKNRGVSIPHVVSENITIPALNKEEFILICSKFFKLIADTLNHRQAGLMELFEGLEEGYKVEEELESYNVDPEVSKQLVKMLDWESVSDVYYEFDTITSKIFLEIGKTLEAMVLKSSE